MATPNVPQTAAGGQPQVTAGKGQKKRDIFWTIIVIALIISVLVFVVKAKYFTTTGQQITTQQAVPVVAPVTSVIELATGQSHLEYVQAKGISWDVVEGCVEATAANSRGSKETRQVCAGQPDHQWPPATYYEYVAFGGNAVIRFNR